MKIERIKPPKYKVGRYSLNEYEVRKLMVDVAIGFQSSGIKVTDINGNSAIIQSNGRLSNQLYGFDISSKFTLELLKIERIKSNTEKYNL